MGKKNLFPTKLRVLSVLVFWILFMCIDVLKKNVYTIDDTNYLLSYYFFGFFVWVCITFPLFSFFQFSERFSIAYRIIFLFLSGPIIGAVKTCLSWTSFYLSLNLFQEGVSLYSFIVKQGSFHFIEATIIAWVVLILFFLSELYLKYQEKSVEASQLKSQLFEARLQTLKMQLHPHFLFNAHNTISMLIRTKKYDQAINMTAQLSELLRATLNEGEKNFISLKEEVDFAKKFLAIESIRFEGTLRVEIKIDPETQEVLVPNLILQPLIENAFKHGISKHLGKSVLQLNAQKVDARIIITIFNTGPYLPKGFKLDENPNIGIKNVISRLKQSYHENLSLNLSNSRDGVVCTIEIPVQ